MTSCNPAGGSGVETGQTFFGLVKLMEARYPASIRDRREERSLRRSGTYRKWQIGACTATYAPISPLDKALINSPRPDFNSSTIDLTFAPSGPSAMIRSKGSVPEYRMTKRPDFPNRFSAS